MGNVGKRSSVHKHRGALKGLRNMELSLPFDIIKVAHLHQVGSDGVLHEDGEGAGHSQVLCCYRVARPRDDKEDIE